MKQEKEGICCVFNFWNGFGMMSSKAIRMPNEDRTVLFVVADGI